jgi:Ca-activated chloride channel family protein
MKTTKHLVLLFISGGILVACGVNAAERNNAGNSLYSQADYDGALQAYQLAQVAAPSLPEPYYNAASALAQIGKLEAAIDALEQAFKTANEELTAQAYYNLGNVYFEMGDYDDAAVAYRETLVRRPDDQDARYNYELALSRILPLTPTALEQQVEPSLGETDPSVTPTGNPGALDGPTPTPPPQEGPPDPNETPVEGGEPGGDVRSATITPQPEGPMTIEDAQRLLDSVQEDQQTLQEFLHDVATPSTPSAEDW